MLVKLGLPGIAKYRATAVAETVALTFVESVDVCEVDPQGVEEPRIQQRAVEQFADFSKAVEEHIPERRVRGLQSISWTLQPCRMWRGLSSLHVGGVLTGVWVQGSRVGVALAGE